MTSISSCHEFTKVTSRSFLLELGCQSTIPACSTGFSLTEPAPLHSRRRRRAGQRRAPRDRRGIIDRAGDAKRDPRAGTVAALAGAVLRTESAVTLACALHPQPGYPWRLDLSVEYRLEGDRLDRDGQLDERLRCSRAVRDRFSPLPDGGNAGGRRLALLTIPARRRLVTDERGLPTSDQTVAGHRVRLHRPAACRVDATRHRLHRTDPGDDGRTPVELDRPDENEASPCGQTGSSAT